MQLVKELKNLLKEKHYSIANAAKAMDISSKTLHLWMNDKYKGNTQKENNEIYAHGGSSAGVCSSDSRSSKNG